MPLQGPGKHVALELGTELKTLAQHKDLQAQDSSGSRQTQNTGLQVTKTQTKTA